MPLCDRCEQKSDLRGRGSTLGTLRTTTCEFCSILYQGIRSVLLPIIPDDRYGVVLPAFSSEKGSRFEVNVFHHRAIVSFWCSWGTACPWGILSSHRDVTSLDYEGEGSFQTALQWVENCTTHHKCSNTGTSPTLPTRVVDTTTPGGPIRLVEGASRKERYNCLSHCWGQERPLVTTSQTLRRHMNEIPWSSIPATFRDAINISRRLGVRYIWIDSLCILQDSVDDWESESSKMAEIYRNSYVTIAAASSRDSKGGLGLDRPRRSGTTLRGTTSSGKLYSIHVQCGIHPHMRMDGETPQGILHPIQPSMEHDYAGVFGVFPLLTRGWVFQERLLSPRFLQFGKDELLWDCRESMLCECGQRPADLPYNQVTITSQIYGLISYKWRKIVEFYCSLSLTVPEDKLPALSGLARQVQELKPGVPYLAGLWGDSLDLDLLWIPYGPENQITNKYIAPSWSWASVGRKIIYPNVWRWNEEQPSIKTLDTYFESIEATCTPSAYDPTGKVRGGRLVLKSVLSTISVYNLTGDGSATEFRHNNTSFSLSTGREPSSLSSNWRLPFEETGKRAFLDHPGTYDRFIDKGSLYSCRLARVEISEDSIYTLVTEAREIIHVEFSLLLGRINEGSNLFKRIGLLADGRFIEGHRGDPESWSKEPSCFESGAEGTTLTII